MRNTAFWFIPLVILLVGGTSATSLAQTLTIDDMKSRMHVCAAHDATYKEISYEEHCGVMKDQGGSLTDREYWNCEMTVDRKNEVIRKWNEHVMKCRQAERQRGAANINAALRLQNLGGTGQPRNAGPSPGVSSPVAVPIPTPSQPLPKPPSGHYETRTVQECTMRQDCHPVHKIENDCHDERVCHQVPRTENKCHTVQQCQMVTQYRQHCQQVRQCNGPQCWLTTQCTNVPYQAQHCEPRQQCASQTTLIQECKPERRCSQRTVTTNECVPKQQCQPVQKQVWVSNP